MNGRGKKEYDCKGHKVLIQALKIPAPVTMIRVDLWIDGMRIVPTKASDFEARSFSKVEDATTYASQAAERMIDKLPKKNVPSGTIVGYDVESGKKLFTETNRATRFPDETDALPRAGDLYEVSGKNYRIVGVRKGSTERLCEVDVREEPPK